MPPFEFRAHSFVAGESTVYGIAVPNGVATDEGAAVRRYAGDPTRTARDGELFPFAIFTTEQIPMEALHEVFGLQVEARWPDGRDASDSVTVQVSVDGGTVFLAYEGGWAAQEEGDLYNSLPEFNEHCSALPLLNPCILGFRFKLTVANNQTPVVRVLRSFVEWRYNPYEDIYDTLAKRFEEFEVETRVQVELDAAGTVVLLEDAYTPASQPAFRAYNLTTDPRRNVDLFGSYDAADKEVTLSAAQARGSLIELNFMGTAGVTLVRKDEDTFLSEVPQTVLRLEVFEDEPARMAGIVTDYKKGQTILQGREREHPPIFLVRVDAEHWSANARTATRSVLALRNLLSKRLKSRATGEVMMLLETSPGRAGDQATESLSFGSWAGKFRLYFHMANYRQLALMRELVLDNGTPTEVWPTEEVQIP